MSTGDTPRRDTTDVTPATSRTTVMTGLVALAATVASVEGLAELLHATAALSMAAAWALGSVMDLAVIVLALQARDAVVAGRGGHIEMALTWAASVASGVASASWQVTHVGVQAAVVRLLLPLLAACLWHLSIVGVRATADARPARRQTRASRLALNLALAQAREHDMTGVTRHERRAGRRYLRHLAHTSLDAQGRDLPWWRDRVHDVIVVTKADGDEQTDTADAAPTGVATVEATTPPHEDVTTPAPGGAPAPGPRPSVRQRIIELRASRPGATASEIHASLGGECSLRTVQRHLAALNRMTTASTD